jgi:hypothetical protein
LREFHGAGILPQLDYSGQHQHMGKIGKQCDQLIEPLRNRRQIGAFMQVFTGLQPF